MDVAKLEFRTAVASPWWTILRRREQDILAICYVLTPTDWDTKGARRHYAVRDVSQSIGRQTTVSSSSGVFELPSGATRSISPTQLPGTKMWLTHQHRLALGREAMLLQGWPIAARQYSSLLEGPEQESLLQSLAGNAFSAPVVLAVAVGFFFAADWNDTAEEAITDDADSSLALGMLAAMRRAPAASS